MMHQAPKAGPGRSYVAALPRLVSEKLIFLYASSGRRLAVGFNWRQRGVFSIREARAAG